MSKRIPQLDGVRAFAVTAVFLNHALHVKLLWMGVDLFFILSGFLITGILIDTKRSRLSAYFGRFYARRARRIVPPYLVLLLVTSALYGLSWARHWYLYLGLMNLFFALPIQHPPTLDPLWSLAVEEQFYLVWPFAVYFLSEAALGWTAGALVIAAPVLRWVATPLFAWHWTIYALTPFRMDLLAVGALLAIAWRHRLAWFRRYGQFGLVLSAVAILLLIAFSRLPGFSTHANTRFANVWIYEGSLLACTGIILWALSGRGVWLLNLGPVRYLGRISYSVYLIHETALAVVLRFQHGENIAALSAFALSVGYASVSWHFMEKPLLGGKRSDASEPTGLG